MAQLTLPRLLALISVAALSLNGCAAGGGSAGAPAAPENVHSAAEAHASAEPVPEAEPAEEAAAAQPAVRSADGRYAVVPEAGFVSEPGLTGDEEDFRIALVNEEMQGYLLFASEERDPDDEEAESAAESAAAENATENTAENAAVEEISFEEYCDYLTDGVTGNPLFADPELLEEREIQLPGSGLPGVLSVYRAVYYLPPEAEDAAESDAESAAEAVSAAEKIGAAEAVSDVETVSAAETVSTAEAVSAAEGTNSAEEISEVHRAELSRTGIISPLPADLASSDASSAADAASAGALSGADSASALSGAEQPEERGEPYPVIIRFYALEGAREYIQFMCWSGEAEAEALSPAFDRMVSSLSFAGEGLEGIEG